VLAILEPVFDPALASVSYLFHLGYAALLKAQFRPGNSVGVIGLGPIGLATLGLASSGGGTAYGFSNQKDIADTARQAGAIEVRSKDISAGAELDIVVTTSNTWPDWHLALNAARPGGTIAVLGFPGRGQPAPDFNPLASQFLYDKQLTVMACGMLPNIDVSPADVRFTVKRNMQWLVNQVGLARLPAQHLVSEIAVADKLGDLYERLANREAGLVTAVLKW
jgi:threonine dehydrogenase-like Zn-dependent dehydrogenase